MWYHVVGKWEEANNMETHKDTGTTLAFYRSISADLTTQIRQPNRGHKLIYQINHIYIIYTCIVLKESQWTTGKFYLVVIKVKQNGISAYYNALHIVCLFRYKALFKHCTRSAINILSFSFSSKLFSNSWPFPPLYTGF